MGTTGKKPAAYARAALLQGHLRGLGLVHSSHVRRVVAITTNSHGKLEILREQGDSFGVNSTKVAIFEETNQISL